MISCITIDDKPLAIDILAEYLSKISFVKLTASFLNPLAGLEYVKQNDVDLIFLDIQMPEITGLQFMQILAGKCKVILVTAYAEYALEGYEHDVIDYLLKPVSFQRFYKAVEKARRQIEIPFTNETKNNTEIEYADNNHNLFVKTDYKIVRISLDEILYIEAKQNYITIVTTNKHILSLQSIKTIEQKLPYPKFVRIHKSYIISVDKIDSVERSRINIGKMLLPIGENYRNGFFQLLGTKS